MATNTGHIMTLANSIIGVSILAMPFCFKQCGITLAILLLILSSIISRLACHFLMKSSLMCRRRNFEFLAFYAFGSSGKLFVELGVIGFMLGTCVAFFVVMGDLGPAIFSKVFQVANNDTLRSSVLIGVGLFIVLPLGLLRNLESLSTISTATIGFYLLLVLKIFSESSSHLVQGDWIDDVNFWRPEGLLQCIPIFAMALSCQTQLFELYDTIPNANLDKMNSVVRSAVNMCTGVYILVGLLGYVACPSDNLAGNVLLSFPPSLSSEMYKLGFVMSLALSFPLVIFPCRASLYSLLFKKMPVHHELSSTATMPDSRFKCLTLLIVSVSLVTGLLIPSIEVVLGFLGSTVGVVICVIFPSVAFVHITNKDTNERLVAKMTLAAGIIIMVVGTYGNLNSATQVKPREFEPQPVPLEAKGPVKPAPDNLVEAVNKMQKLERLGDTKLKDQEKSIPSVVVVEPPIVKVEAPPVPIVEQSKRQEPPVPLPPVQEVKETKPSVEPVKTAERKEVELEKKPPEPEPSRVIENIAKDAIEKEEREEKEAEKQRKTDEEKKQEELLKKLKEHEIEQKKLLEEQQKILSEMKNREPENKEDRELEKKEEEKPAKEIDSNKFSENIEKIQNVIEDLKDKKELIEKEKSEGKKVEEAKRKEMISMPLPLAKLQEVKSKKEAAKRDILESEGKREKRDVDENQEECDKKVERTEKDKATGESEESEMIKKSVLLSVPESSGRLDTGEGLKEGVASVSDVPLLAPKSRDLKSVKDEERTR